MGTVESAIRAAEMHTKTWERVDDEIKGLKAKLAEAIELLKGFEWVSSHPHEHCPDCLSFDRDYGHNSFCAVAKFLRENEGGK